VFKVMSHLAEAAFADDLDQIEVGDGDLPVGWAEEPLESR
jgi:hypothetical protein